MSVADILEQMAQNAGRARLTKGGLIGQAISDLSLAPGQIQNEHEREAIFNEERMRRRAADARSVAQDQRQTAKDAQDEKKRQAEETHQANIDAILTAYHGGTPNDPSTNSLDAGVAKAKELGMPGYIGNLEAMHATEMKPTQTNPALDTWVGGKLVRPGVTKPMTPAEEAQRTETARHNKEVERVQALNAGKADAAQKEAERHNRATEATAAKVADPFGLSAPPNGSAAIAAGRLGGAGGTGPSGDAFLQTLAPGLASDVKAYAEGRRPFPTGMATAKLQPMLQLVGQYDPTFDAANYNARNKARTDLASPSGTGGKTIGALNTAIQHAGKLSDLIEKLDNYESPLANALVNPLRTAAGHTEVTNYDTVAPQLAKEIERVWRGAGGTAGEIHDLIETIGHNKGKQQQREALSQFVDLAKGKLDSLEQQRDNVMGKTAGATIPILFDQNKPIMEKIAQRAGGKPADATSAPAEGQTGSVNGVPAVWKTVNGKAGWYAR